MRILKIFLILFLVFPAGVYAFPIAAPGTEGLSVIVNSTADVIATYEGNSAAYSNDLYVGLNLGNANTFIFNNHGSPVGSMVNLGSFSIGTELIFRLHVRNTGYDFYSGDASRNPDGYAHARVQQNWQPGVTLVSFEDLYNGPFVYNDLSFSFTNTTSGQPSTIPEPTTMLLVGSGLIGLAGFRRRLKKN
jgi:hypothetical protein